MTPPPPPDGGAEERERQPVRFLWLLRHGKAASDAPWGGSDAERPLTARGRRDATALGRRLAAGEGVLGLDGVRLPDVVLGSAAVRTRQTAELVVDGMGERPLDLYRSLYGAETTTVLQYLRELDDGVGSAMVVGHNPTMYRLAWELLPDDAAGEEAGPDGSSDRARLREHGFPTCSLAVLVLTVSSWEDVAAGSGALAGVFSPPY